MPNFKKKVTESQLGRQIANSLGTVFWLPLFNKKTLMS